MFVIVSIVLLDTFNRTWVKHFVYHVLRVNGNIAQVLISVTCVGKVACRMLWVNPMNNVPPVYLVQPNPIKVKRFVNTANQGPIKTWSKQIVY